MVIPTGNGFFNIRNTNIVSNSSRGNRVQLQLDANPPAMSCTCGYVPRFRVPCREVIAVGIACRVLLTYPFREDRHAPSSQNEAKTLLIVVESATCCYPSVSMLRFRAPWYQSQFARAYLVRGLGQVMDPDHNRTGVRAMPCRQNMLSTYRHRTMFVLNSKA